MLTRLFAAVVLSLFLLPSVAYADDGATCKAMVSCGFEEDVATCVGVLGEVPELGALLSPCVASAGADCDKLDACFAQVLGEGGGDMPANDKMAAEPAERPVPGGAGAAGGHDLTIKSRTSALEATGDLSSGELRMLDDSCGIFLSTTPSEAIFYMCNDKVVEGPFTTEAQVQALFTKLSKQEKAAHDTTMSIINNMPSGGDTKVQEVDENGNVVNEYWE